MSRPITHLIVFGVLTILSLPTDQAQAEKALREVDFAYGRRIRLETETPLYQFTVDAHVYRHVADRNLSDLRIFNSREQHVPLQIRRIDPQNPTTYIHQELPIFPLYAGVNSTPEEISLSFGSSANGTHITFNRTDSSGQINGVSGFIVDLGQSDNHPDRLEIDLTSNQTEYRLSAKVSYGDDLNNWKTLVSSSALVKMAFKGQYLERNYIDLPFFSGRYLNITLNTPFDGGLSARITGRYAQTAAGPARQSVKIKGNRVASDSEIFIFDSGGFFPVDRIQLRLPKGNSLAKVKLSTRPNAEAAWRHRITALFHRLKIDTADLENAPVEVPLIQDRYLRIEVIAGSLPSENSELELELFWHAHECVFVASGEPPFMLVYGNTDILHASQAMDDLLKNIDPRDQSRYLGAASLEAPQVLGGDERLKASNFSNEQLLRAVLWTVLLLSVAAIAYMALRLYSQLKR